MSLWVRRPIKGGCKNVNVKVCYKFKEIYNVSVERHVFRGLLSPLSHLGIGIPDPTQRCNKLALVNH